MSNKGFSEFMKNPYWKRMYENAPSEELKEFYRIQFETSPFVMGDDYHDAEAEKKMKSLLLSKEDIQYMQKYAGSGQARAYYGAAIKALSGEYEGYKLPAEKFEVEIWNPWYMTDTEQ